MAMGGGCGPQLVVANRGFEISACRAKSAADRGGRDAVLEMGVPRMPDRSGRTWRVADDCVDAAGVRDPGLGDSTAGAPDARLAHKAQESRGFGIAQFYLGSASRRSIRCGGTPKCVRSRQGVVARPQARPVVVLAARHLGRYLEGVGPNS